MKRTASFLLVAILLLSIFGQSVYASTSNSDLDKVLHRVEIANSVIDQLIQSAVDEAEVLYQQILVLESSTAIDQEVQSEIEMLNKQIDNIIENLISKTNQISKNTVEFAAKFGITVQCTYVEVEIGGRIEYIDPLRVIGS